MREYSSSSVTTKQKEEAKAKTRMAAKNTFKNFFII
jgi:hypothetical protein